MSSLASIPGEARCKQVVHYLLTRTTSCARCSGRLSWKREYGWCRSCRTKVRPKAATWFRGSKLSYRQLFQLLHCWQQRQSPGAAKLATGLSYTTIHRWFWRFREHVPADDQNTMLSGIERDTRRLKLQIVPDTEQDSLEGFLEAHVARGSLVVTDCGTGYSGIAWLGFPHETWNHSKGHFAGTNHIESTWSAMKRYLRKLYGCVPTKHIQLVLNEWMARHNCKQLFASPIHFLQATCSGLVG